MPAYEPHFDTLLARRRYLYAQPFSCLEIRADSIYRLLSLYYNLHANVHAKNSHLKVHHCVSRNHISLAWVTPPFEMYCVAGQYASRNALAQSANKVVQWARREEERVFIIGGAVRILLSPISLGYYNRYVDSNRR